jgi:hypothetical protein
MKTGQEASLIAMMYLVSSPSREIKKKQIT